jgi:serine-type D-Ala-D-Ala carboxypeptidase (penicillin-binding protein 5/6)
LPSAAAVLLGAVAACGVPGPAAAAPAPPAAFDRFPGLAAAYAVRIDGEITWAAGLDLPRPPASLAKLLTAWTLLQDGWDPEAWIPVSGAAADIEGSQVGLRAGERLRARDLLTALLVRSGNDACVALVEHAAGSLAGFRPRVAAAARRLGLAATRIEHPCGLDAPGQQSTARDLLRLADAALALPDMRLRGGVQSAEIRTEAGRTIRFGNSNALIGRVPQATGLKSGYTSKAGRCLIAVGEDGTHQVVIVMLGARDRWWEAAGLIPQALGHARLRAAPR